MDSDLKNHRYHYHILMENVSDLELKIFLSDEWGSLREISQIKHVAKQAL